MRDIVSFNRAVIACMILSSISVIVLSVFVAMACDSFIKTNDAIQITNSKISGLTDSTNILILEAGVQLQYINVKEVSDDFHILVGRVSNLTDLLNRVAVHFNI